jgi:hypothetical protein
MDWIHFAEETEEEKSLEGILNGNCQSLRGFCGFPLINMKIADHGT